MTFTGMRQVAKDVIKDFTVTAGGIDFSCSEEPLAQYMYNYSADNVEMAYAIGTVLLLDLYTAELIETKNRCKIKITAAKAKKIANKRRPDFEYAEAFKWTPDVIGEVTEKCGELFVIAIDKMTNKEVSETKIEKAKIAMEYIQSLENEVNSETSRYRTPDEVREVYNEKVEEAKRHLKYILGEKEELTEIMKKYNRIVRG